MYYSNRPVAAFFLSLTLTFSGIAFPSSSNDKKQDDNKKPKSSKFIKAKNNRAENAYIVKFKDGLTETAEEEVIREVKSKQGGNVHQRYKNAAKGFAVEMSESDALALSTDPRVEFVEEDQIISLEQETVSIGQDEFVTVQGVQANPQSWGLSRIDQRDLPVDANYNYPTTGAGVTVYVLDTGINPSHQEFNGRASYGFDAIGDGQNGLDCNGHGTHVAGTVGGTNSGVAKDVNIVSVRVLGCNGSGLTSGVIAGVDWVTANHTALSVANMSLGGGISASLDTAVQNSIASGVTYVLAAGNSAVDAMNSSPGRVSQGITVAASDSNDGEAGFSNFGSVVDIYAPGVGIVSAYYGNNTGYSSLSGTSMAAPHVAGAAALYLESNSAATPAQVQAALVGSATPDRMSNRKSSATPNRLLYVLSFAPAPPINSAPVASFTYSVSNSTVTFNGSGSSDPDGQALTYAWNFGNGATAYGANVTYNYQAAGTYNVSLTVTDTYAISNTTTQSVTTTAAPNTNPTADFTYSCTELRCSFNGSLSADSNGSIASYTWNFGNGQTATGATPIYTYSAQGNYNVTLTVTDNDGATGVATRSVNVTVPVVIISLTAKGYYIGTTKKVDLKWTGATTSTVDMWRNGVFVKTVNNVGSFTDLPTMSGVVTYKICNRGRTDVCSNTPSVRF